VERDRTYQAILDTAADKGCDLIVMASHGRRGLSKLLLGSETTRVLTHSSVPVLVCR
jgi:nucleotide-binding universal stress UspA family protein